jgi:hypothetical protein
VKESCPARSGTDFLENFKKTRRATFPLILV